MKKRGWKWALVLFAAMAAVVGWIFWDAQRRADAIFDRHERELVQEFARMRSLTHSRPALKEPALAGNGWDAYTKALDAADAIPVGDKELLADYGTDVTLNADLEALEAAAARHGAVVKQLDDLFRTSEFQPDYAYEDGASMLLPYVSKAVQAAYFLRGISALRHAQGRDGDALELLPTLLRIGQDSGRGGPLVNSLVQILCEGVVAQQGQSILADHSLRAPELERFAALLDAFEAQRPPMSRGMDVDGVQMRQTLVQIARSGEDSGLFVMQGITAGRSWRFLFSRRLVYAQALTVLQKFHADVADLERLPMWERAAAADLATREAGQARNPMIEGLLPAVVKGFKREAVSCMSLALLRVSIAIAWYEAEKGKPPERLDDLVPRHLPSVPLCPLSGQPLRYQPGKLWSVGADREDDGGRPPTNENDDDGGDADVVWTIKRK